MPDLVKKLIREVKMIPRKYPKGFSSTDEHKWDGLRPVFAQLTGLSEDNIHFTTTTNSANVPKRLHSGNAEKQHFPLVVLAIPRKLRKLAIEKGKLRLGTAIGQFNCLAVLDMKGGMISDVVAEERSSVVRNILAKYPTANAVIVSQTPDSSSSVSSASMANRQLVDTFLLSLKSAKLSFPKQILVRFLASLLAKPFVILTGLSGSGKTKLAEAFAKWLGTPFGEAPETGSKYLLVPVGSDWTTNEHLLGYPDALQPGRYCLPDSKVLQFLLSATKKENSGVPYFLILDEMNLSHVERYFADFLSAMESTDRTIHLHGEAGDLDSGGVKVPAKLKLPDNLFVIGTMNVDETTHMVSPKVLDRAQVLEFRVSHDDIDGFLDKSESVDLGTLTGGGSFAATFLNLAQERGSKKPTGAMNDLKTTLLKAFDELSKLGAEFAFRSTAEIVSFAGFAEEAGLSSDEAIDAAILQKLLPKVHGSRRKLEKPLAALWGICLKSDDKGKDTDKPTTLQATREEFGKDFYESHCRFPWTGEKIARMYRQAVDNGFASFAEA